LRLHVRHETVYAYAGTVAASYNELRLLPAPVPTQVVVTSRLDVRPHGYACAASDYYGNHVTYLEVRRPHRELRIDSELVVDTVGGPLPAGPAPVAAEYLQPGSLTRMTEAPDLDAGDPESLMAAVHAHLTYRPGATDTTTDVNRAIALGAGVCQDFAHVYVALARRRNWPARYVGGYLLQDGPGTTHAAHAWVEVLQRGVWTGLDPTNACPVDERYLRVTCGRDYADAPPVRGVYVGTGTGALRVHLDVAAEVAATSQ
jgi:transglutaminase-like putative cysteine protease